MFAEMTDLIPAARKGVAEIKHPTGPEACCQLWVDGKCVMNAAPSLEIGLNRPVIEAARGDVLITGLGIGYILIPILAKPEVRSVTVIEKCQDVVDLVLPYLAHPKLTVILADAYEWVPSETYDTMWFDIYPHDEQVGVTLMNRFTPYLRPGGWAKSIY